MLSKYYHMKKENSRHTAGAAVPVTELESALYRSLKQRHNDVTIGQILSGGTLGIFFRLSADGRKKFAKTHQAGETYRENLCKEIKIMSLLYKDSIEMEEVRVPANGTWFVFLVMDELYPCAAPPLPAEIRACIRDYEQKLRPSLIPAEYSFGQVLEAGRESLEALHAEGFLRYNCYCCCKDSLERMWEYGWKEQSAVCHGDLSNVNIMQDEQGRLVVIDWEDALTAFSEYDFLYWLTFFSQRNYYAPGLLRSYGINPERGTDLMVLITIIKSQMSYWNGSYAKNRISFQDRIHEIYQIKEG